MIKEPKQKDVQVGSKIQHYRVKANIPLLDLANKSGIGYQLLKKYEEGTESVPQDKLEIIATTIGVSIDAFSEDNDCSDNFKPIRARRKLHVA